VECTINVQSGQNVPAPTLSSPIQDYLEYLYSKYLELDTGAVADYIPELGTANPDWFGITIVTVDGHVYQAGDTNQPFTIQSISKPIVYGLALEDSGIENVLNKVGVEPSGDAFNSISLDPTSGRPFNPMINTGAVATTGLVDGNSQQEKLERILSVFSRYVGHPLKIDEAVYISERDTGHRNRAISHLLRNFDIVDGNPEDTLDLYFKQCSISVTCRDLALMAGCLANGGINPITGVIALDKRYVGKVLSVMTSCGMYDYAGGWIYDVGLPAKSGVAGGIMAVLPGQLGIGVFSPPLDFKGNSVRGVHVCRELSGDFSLHMFNPARSAPSVIRAKYDASTVFSRRYRQGSEHDVLKQEGGRIRIYELHGELMFSTTEIVLSTLYQDIDDLSYLVLDFKRVYLIDGASCRLLASLVDIIRNSKKHVFFTNAGGNYAFRRDMQKLIKQDVTPGLFEFDVRDKALEWCENQLLLDMLEPRPTDIEYPLNTQHLFLGLDDEELEYLHGFLKRLEYEPGDFIVEAGEQAESIYFLARGEVTVMLPTNGSHEVRLAVLSPGMAFGEMAMLEHNERSAHVRAESPVICYALNYDALEGESNMRGWAIQMKLLKNLSRQLSHKLRIANDEIRSLS